MQIVQFPDGSKRNRPRHDEPDDDERHFVTDEHDQGGFGHTPWGVGIQNRFPKPMVANPENLPIFETRGARPAIHADNGSWEKVRRFMMRFLSRH